MVLGCFGGIPKRPRAIRAFRTAIWSKHGLQPIPDRGLLHFSLRNASGNPENRVLGGPKQGFRDPSGGGVRDTPKRGFRTPKTGGPEGSPGDPLFFHFFRAPFHCISRVFWGPEPPKPCFSGYPLFSAPFSGRKWRGGFTTIYR